ncbi:MAG TPA: sigma-70 family RNA polymerase sigma factor [Arenibaculum sp.]|nr:sigma-70 family RNA polymerase sigma factor [Arenibaculum sp.]
MPDELPDELPVDGERLPDGLLDANELLVAVARDRDRRAFASLFGHFAPRVKSYLMRLGASGAQAEELVQEVMLMVWRRAGTFDPSRASAATWIFAVARNKRIDAIRRERRPEIATEDPVLVPDPPETADRLVAAEQESVRLCRAITRLPAEQAALVRMAYFEDRPHGDIAQRTGLPLGTVKSRLRLALGRLRREFDEP